MIIQLNTLIELGNELVNPKGIRRVHFISEGDQVLNAPVTIITYEDGYKAAVSSTYLQFKNFKEKLL